MTLRVVLVDDAETDRKHLPRRIQDLSDDEIEVFALPPPPDLDLEEVLSANADLFLVDYELDTRQVSGSVAPYMGMTFAARLREVRPAYPIVLLTRSNLPAWTAAQRTARAGSTFDDIMYKDTGLDADPLATYAKLVSLARGYQRLRKSSGRSLPALLGLLQTDDVGWEKAEEALPPPDDWREFEAAHWIRSVLLRYPGVLYTTAHAATAVGVSLDDFKREQVLDLLRDAEYRGPFCEEGPYWWRHKLFDIAYRLSGTSNSELGLRERFRLASANMLGFELAPSKDVETGAVPADTVCYLLEVPVRIETSLPYQPDSRPPVMESARISFKAVRESNDVEEMHVEAASRTRLDELRASG
ncbi:MAG: hypothetical protein OXF41_16380 [bacterium]|nr:hypothetical protein [bacterium]